jgi:hypothetical protein
MEADPIDPSLMPLQYFNALNLYSDEGREIFALCEFFLENSVIPDSDSGVKGPTDDEIFLWVELSAHNIMTVTRNDIYACPTLIIPDTHCLIITSGKNPRKLVVEVRGTNVINMAF